MRPPLFCASIDHLMTREERLMAIDMDTKLLDEVMTSEGESEGMAWFIADLAGFAITQADMEYKAEGHENDNDPQAYANRIVTMAQMIWDEFVNYLKDTRDIELHPMSMLQVLLSIYIDQEDTPIVVTIKRAIINQIETMYKDAPEELKTVEVPDIPEINNSTDPDGLLKSFFQLLSDIGTFHRNRSEYTTDEQRNLHDRIIATYYRLGELNF